MTEKAYGFRIATRVGSSNTKQNQFFRFVRAMGVDIIIKAGECDKFQSMVGALGIGDRESE